MATMRWHRITRLGTIAEGKPQPNPGPGVWVATEKGSHTSWQHTVEFLAINGQVTLVANCYCGQHRHAFFDKAISAARVTPVNRPRTEVLP